MPPSVASNYQIITALGRGGMGEVFLAAMPGPPGLNQVAVIKKIWPELADEPEVTSLFLDEARLALRLRHRNIVQTFEVGQDETPAGPVDFGGQRSSAYIAMEYLAGQPLSQIIRVLRGSEGFSLQTRIHILTEVLNALDYAHSLRDVDGTPLGVVHRDISPHNVFVTYDGDVKLMDFGIAKSLFASHQTRPGVFRGRFAYGAPEQILGSTVDRRADLFAVGIMLWELLTDRRMFQGKTEADIVRILGGNAAPPTLPPDRPVGPELKFICARALALHPSARYQTAAEFRRDLLDVLANCLPPEPRPLGRLVTCAFAQEKRALEALIHRFFFGADPAPAAPLAALAGPAPSVFAGDATLVDPPPPPPAAVPTPVEPASFYGDLPLPPWSLEQKRTLPGLGHAPLPVVEPTPPAPVPTPARRTGSVAAAPTLPRPSSSGRPSSGSWSATAAPAIEIGGIDADTEPEAPAAARGARWRRVLTGAATLATGALFGALVMGPFLPEPPRATRPGAREPLVTASAARSKAIEVEPLPTQVLPVPALSSPPPRAPDSAFAAPAQPAPTPPPALSPPAPATPSARAPVPRKWEAPRVPRRPIVRPPIPAVPAATDDIIPEAVAAPPAPLPPPALDTRNPYGS